MHSDDYYMKQALEQATIAFDNREVPVGCVIVDDATGKIVGVGANRTNEFNNGTKHCEIIAMSSLPLQKYFSNHTLYVTVEPCVMCAAALRIMGLAKVKFGCSNERFGGCGSVLNAHNLMPNLLPSLELTGDIKKEEAILLLQNFYQRGNIKLPETKRHRRKNI